MAYIQMLIFPVTSAKPRHWLIIKTFCSDRKNSRKELLYHIYWWIQENPATAPHLPARAGWNKDPPSNEGRIQLTVYSDTFWEATISSELKAFGIGHGSTLKTTRRLEDRLMMERQKK